MCPEAIENGKGPCGPVDYAADLWALASTAAVFRGFHSTFGQAAAVLHRRPQSVIVHRDGCAGAPPASKRRSLDALQHSLFCRAHEEGTGGRAGGLGS